MNDNDLCALAAKDPQNYILPHPDCTQFYVCQFLGGTRWRGGWKAHVFDCPAKTGFDYRYKVCNWLSNLKKSEGGCIGKLSQIVI